MESLKTTWPYGSERKKKDGKGRKGREERERQGRGEREGDGRGGERKMVCSNSLFKM